MSNSSSPAGEVLRMGPETVNGRRPGLALVVIGAAQLMVMLDMTIVNIALPAMQRALGFSTVNLEWSSPPTCWSSGGCCCSGDASGTSTGRAGCS